MESWSRCFVVGRHHHELGFVADEVLAALAVHGGGESGAIEHVADHLQRTLGAAVPYPECAAGLDDETAVKLATAYFGHFGGLGGATHVTDKMPDNFRWLGVIALLG